LVSASKLDKWLGLDRTPEKSRKRPGDAVQSREKRAHPRNASNSLVGSEEKGRETKFKTATSRGGENFDRRFGDRRNFARDKKRHHGGDLSCPKTVLEEKTKKNEPGHGGFLALKTKLKDDGGPIAARAGGG